MNKMSGWIVRHKKLILVLAVLLLIPSAMGMAATRVNFDMLTYLPESLETVEGQNIMVEDFGMGAFAMVMVENMELKDVASLKEDLLQIDHVKDVLWYDSLVDLSVPPEMMPEELRDMFFQDDATLMIVLIDDSTSSDASLEAMEQIRKTASKDCFVSSMTNLIVDVKDLTDRELPIYVTIAVLLSFLVLELAMDSFLVPVLFLLSIGAAILYNMGTNILMGEISYVTQALAAVLQLGVTMDHSIFLLNSYEEYKREEGGDSEKAMASAISATFRSVVGSSVTTIAGFIALCFMSFTLGLDMGIVMAKGVVFGVICCITLLPAMILVFDKAIEKTKHRTFIPKFGKISRWITGHPAVGLILFLVLIGPAVYGNSHYPVYYNMDRTLPEELPSQMANKKLSEEFDMNTLHMVLLQKGLPAKEKIAMMDEIEKVDGVKWVIGTNSLVGPAVPESMIPERLRTALSSDNYEVEFICSEYKVATDEMHRQLDEINDIVKSVSPEAMVIGEGPLTRDLIKVTDTDFKHVSTVSIAAILVIILFVFKSISLPFLLVAVIEFAIFINMSFACYMNVTLPFIAGIVIGTVQLGATVDYAILMTSRYQVERASGKSKKEAVATAHESSMKSILVSGCSFFAATFGVGLYSEIDMISALCTLLARGALVSMFVVILVLPSILLIFDKVIVHTSIGFRKEA